MRWSTSWSRSRNFPNAGSASADPADQRAPMLRRAAGRHTAGMQQAAETATAAAPRVFVVEDSVPIRERIDAMIAQAGAAIAGHASGATAAIQHILEQRPDLVIL